MNLRCLTMDLAKDWILCRHAWVGHIYAEKLPCVEDLLSDRETKRPFLSCPGTQLDTTLSVAKVGLVVGRLRTGLSLPQN